MVQVRNVVEVEYGHFADVIRCYEELNEICRSRGWQPATLMTRAGGRANVLCACTDYNSIEQWDREVTAAHEDPEFMKVLRQAAPHCVQGTACEEIWTDAPHMA